MKQMFAFWLVLFGVLSSPVMAEHANPWATEDDTVLSKNHDANQARSIDTPGEDEMRGALVQKAIGKLSTPGTIRKGGQGRDASKGGKGSAKAARGAGGRSHKGRK